MSWRKFLPFREIDETVHHFHRITLALTLVGTMSIQSVLTAYLEDVKDVWYSFILTFPLTTGLIIIFLVMYHLNWKKITLGTLVACLSLFVVVFLVLNGFASLFHLRQYGEKIQAEQAKQAQIQRSADSIASPGQYVAEALQKQKTADSLWKIRWEANRMEINHVQENLDQQAAEAAKFSMGSTETPWYLRLLLPITVPSKILYNQFVDFYTFYGASRFWIGVALALILTYYIEYLRKKAMKAMENPGNSE
jgi:ABC-type multidrug transport system fused ATPase/permease subunit